MPQVVEQTIEVPEMAEQILDVLVPETVEQSVTLPSTVSEDRLQERTAERIIPVLQVVEELVEVSTVFRQDRIQQCFVEQTDETPDISLAEKIVEELVTQTQWKTLQVSGHRSHRNTQAGEMLHAVTCLTSLRAPAFQVKTHMIPSVCGAQKQMTSSRIEIPPAPIPHLRERRRRDYKVTCGTCRNQASS